MASSKEYLDYILEQLSELLEDKRNILHIKLVVMLV